MSPHAGPRTQLPLAVAHRDGSRSPMTCTWKCADACSQPVPNTSENAYFGDVVASSRRSVLRAGALSATAATLGGLAGVAGAQPAAAAPGPGTKGRPHLPRPTSPFGFEGIDPVPAGTDEVVVPKGFQWAPIIAWGDPILPGAPAFDFDSQTSAAQAGQFGYNCDYVGVIPTNRNGKEAVLVANNEYTNNELMFAGYAGASSLTDDQVRITMMAHGMSVVEMRRRDKHSRWTYRKAAPLNRRITAVTPFDIVGPVRGSELVRTSADPRGVRALGTFGNCAGGTTPWDTVLSGEENFNGYFTQPASAGSDRAGQALTRYGLASGSSAQHAWDRVEPRFDLTHEPQEANRFGWIIEVDPLDPTSTPKKLTALGRMKHEGANVIISDSGHVVAYMGDDERYDYMYKFVSAKRYRKGDRRHNATLLHEGDLYVATFDAEADGTHDGQGRWVPLTQGGRSAVPGFTHEEVLVYTRLAADAVGATKMDRPEDVEPNLVTGKIYAALTNNSRRTAAEVDGPNPRPSNKHGQVLEITERRGDHTGTRFAWRLVLVCGDPQDPQTYFLGYCKSEVSPISCPDNLAFDGDGNLWISTDGNALGHCDGMYLYPLEGREAGHLQQLLSVPAYSECCGPLIQWDDRVVFAAVQHPGEDTGASTTNVLSTFPYQGNTQPRPAVIMVWPKNRGKGPQHGEGHGHPKR
ncbi:PhoX family phosphatase [Janibacter sp. UYMM211]|uniref:PhoX family protein n=1 Tax=Janibacter sp. UYMM211 TaxID=3156342 RepID=UPI00339468D8